MYIDRSKLEQYPFTGEFYINAEIDYTKPPSEWEATEETIFITKCDVQGNARSNNASFYYASYVIYFPFDKIEGIAVQMGQRFRCSAYGVNIDGEVISVVPSQLGSCAAYVKDTNAEDFSEVENGETEIKE